jgi:hypothetical protein
VKRKKPRIKTKGKLYGLAECGLYSIKTKKRLSTVINIPLSRLIKLCSDEYYRPFEVVKSGKVRALQAPVYELDVVHTRIASLLMRVSLPESIHSGIKGRSNVTNAEQHIGDHPVLTMDIKSFYPSVSQKSIYHFFSTKLNCSPDVAGILAKICTYKGCLPTGSRLSMPLAFWSNAAMYQQLESLCINKGIRLTVFVDDLTFSGTQVNRKLATEVEMIIRNAGLTVHPNKTKLYSSEQPKLITGVVVDKCGTRVRNKHHKLIYQLFTDMKSCENDAQLKAYQKELIGRLSAAGQINPIYKSRAKTYTKTLQSR